MDKNFEKEVRRPSERRTNILEETLEQVGTGPTEHNLDLAGIVDPFKRRDSISRSPPSNSIFGARPRSDSCPNVKEASSGKSAKRRREDAPGSPTDADKDARVFLENIKRMNKFAQDLVKEINNMYNPKKEIKKLASNIAYLAREIENSKDQFVTSEVKKPESTDVGIQADIPEAVRSEVGEAQLIEITLDQGQVYDDLDGVMDLKWPESVYKSVQLEKGYPWSLNRDWDLAAVVNSQEDEPSKGYTKALVDKVPGFVDLMNAGVLEGRLDYLQRSTRISSLKDEVASHTVMTYVLPVKIGLEQDTKSWRKVVYEMVRDLAQISLANGRKNIAFCSPNTIDRVLLRKILEYVFRKTSINVMVLLPSEKSRGPIRNQSHQGESGTVIIKAEGKTYAELLKSLKENVDIKGLGLSVKNLRKTNSGDVLLKVGGGRKEADALKEEIKSKVGGTTVTVKTKERVLHIADIDAVTTIEEVQASLDSFPECKPLKGIYVKSLRPTKDGNQMATVLALPAIAEILLKKKRVNIGWSRCRIRERVVVPRCYRCLEFGHIAHECKGENHETECINCSETGHKAKECKAPAKCRFCEGASHRSDSTRCPKFRQLLKDRALKGTQNP